MAEPPIPRGCVDNLGLDIDLLGRDNLRCVRPADKLEGRVRVTVKHPLHFTRAEGYLQGIETTIVVAHDGTRCNGGKTFLDVACRSAIPQELSSEVRISEYIYGIPFLFIMPDGSEFAPPTRQTFPPSFNSRNAYFHSWSPIPIPDISISYCLQIVLTYTLETPTTANLPITVVMSKPIEFLPYYEVPPPISSESFPGDFTLSVRRPLWKSSLYGRLGFVTVSTKEPSPLAYSSDQAMVSTECEFDITIECDLAAIRRLRYTTVVVQPVISAKTFYSSEKLPYMPSQSLSTGHGSVHNLAATCIHVSR